MKFFANTPEPTVPRQMYRSCVTGLTARQPGRVCSAWNSATLQKCLNFGDTANAVAKYFAGIFKLSAKSLHEFVCT